MQITIAAFLINDRVDGHRGLAGLPVADDQFALAAPDGNHRVDGLDSGLQRLLHRASIHHAGRNGFDVARIFGYDGTLAVDRLPERIYHAPDHRFANRHRHDAAGAPDFVAFLDLLIFAQQHRSHLVFFQIERDSGDAVRKLHHLAGHYVFQAIDARDGRHQPKSPSLSRKHLPLFRSAQFHRAVRARFHQLGFEPLFIPIPYSAECPVNCLRNC